ncbi:MAG: hypothetical protein JWN06_426 [Propionibacteriaceae bacterium]|jgi:hypothetical protein|nr:hypothetical protein [Propionibacteriaceae bacterium]
MAWGATFDVTGADPESYDQILPLLEDVTHGCRRAASSTS